MCKYLVTRTTIQNTFRWQAILSQTQNNTVSIIPISETIIGIHLRVSKVILFSKYPLMARDFRNILLQFLIIMDD